MMQMLTKKKNATRGKLASPVGEQLFSRPFASRISGRYSQQTASRQAMRSTDGNPLQTKLAIGSVNDPYEQEADRVADHIVNMPESAVSAPLATHPSSSVQRKCACGGSGDDQCTCGLNRKTLPQKAGADGSSAMAPPIVHDVLQASGQPLGHDIRAYMEPRFGHDFSQVRVHTDTRAAESAGAVDALAYTVGNHVVFGHGGYDPGSSVGKRLLAHELTHTIQQGASVRRAASPVPIGTGGAQISRRTSSTVQRAVTKGCVAPSFVVSPVVASAFGTVAELEIEPDYISQMGGTPFADVFLDNPMGPMAYVAFLAAHHPSLNIASLAIQIGLSGGVLVPDILDSRPIAGVPEFYEIKPDSPDGRALGRGKLAAIDAFMSFNSLPYVRGTTYTPTASIPMPISSVILGGLIGLPLVLSCGLPTVTLEPVRTAPGLIVYQVCVEADFDCYLKALSLVLLLALIIIAILLGRGVQIPIPELDPVPTPVIASGGEGQTPDGTQGNGIPSATS
jgi:hypothetical protein